MMYKVERADIDHASFLEEAMDRFSNNEPDIFLVSREGFKIYTQRSLLSLHSKNMAFLLSSIPCCLSTSISLPVSSNAINNLLRILYKGVATAYEERDLALVNEAAELLGIILGDYNIKMKKNEVEKSSDVTQDTFAVNNGLESEYFQESLLMDNLDEGTDNSNVVVKVEILNEIIDDKEMLSELVDKMEAENESSEPIIVDQIPENNAMDKVQSLGEEVERMGANIETLAEELDRIDDEKNEDEINIDIVKKVEEETITSESRNISQVMPEIFSLLDNKGVSNEEPSKLENMDRSDEQSFNISDKPTTDNKQNSIRLDEKSSKNNILKRQISQKYNTEDNKKISKIDDIPKRQISQKHITEDIQNMQTNSEKSLKNDKTLKRQISQKHIVEDNKNVHTSNEKSIKIDKLLKRQISEKHITHDSKNVQANGEKSLKREISKKNIIDDIENMDTSNGKTTTFLEKQLSQTCIADDATNLDASNTIQVLEKSIVNEKSKCDICQKCFKRQQGLDRHIEKFHPNEKKITLNKVKKLDEKMEDKKDNNIDEVACKYCGKVFRSPTSNYPLLVAKANLQKHILKHLKGEKTSFPPSDVEPLPTLANILNTPSIMIPPSSAINESRAPKETTENLVKPIVNSPVEEKIVKNHSCQLCSKSFSTKEVLALHKKIHHSQEKAQTQEKFTCDKCGKSFNRMDKLEKHMLFHDPKPVQSKAAAFKCDMCDKSFAKMDRLHLHRSYHTTFEQQTTTPKLKVSCDHCDKQFESSQNLWDHKLKIHPTIKQQVSSPVNAKATTKSDDVMLVNVVKNDMNSQSFFTCEKCNESFVSMEVLEMHRQTSHESHECNGCDKVFETETDLMEHIVVHINGSNGESTSVLVEQNIAAPTENLDYQMSEAMEIENEELLHCSICDMIFSDEDMLKNHNRAHSEEMLLTVRMPIVDITKNNVLCLSDFD